MALCCLFTHIFRNKGVKNGRSWTLGFRLFSDPYVLIPLSVIQQLSTEEIIRQLNQFKNIDRLTAAESKSTDANNL